ncbi:MAG: hypothetical protein P1V35_16915, partial [Planctomycetota bacterium]|nr:hypothetical protein [Planctomycetota bacterium]
EGNTHRYRWLDPIGTSTYAGTLPSGYGRRGCESARMTDGMTHKYIYAECTMFGVRWFTNE